MTELAHYSFVAAFASLGGAMILYVASVVAAIMMPSWSPAAVGAPMASSVASAGRNMLGRWATILTINAFAFLTASLAFRTIIGGRSPFSNMFEFSLAFSWGALALCLYFDLRYRLWVLAILVLPVTLGLLGYATTVSSDIQPLVPALQHDLLLTAHVAVAIVAYGAFTVGFAAAVLYLVQTRRAFGWLPHATVLDEIGHKTVMVGFPMLALVLILGAVWAEIAWGAYWSWDPKETSALVTWLIYGGYLHARTMRGWRGSRSAWLLIGGFAATLFTYYGNLFFGGLHSYA